MLFGQLLMQFIELTGVFVQSFGSCLALLSNQVQIVFLHILRAQLVITFTDGPLNFQFMFGPALNIINKLYLI
jgi:hypothetical protein